MPGGSGSTASGEYSLAAGRKAETQTSADPPTTHDGAFVWGDSTNNTVRSERANQVVFQAGGGMKVYTDSDPSNSTGAELPSGSGSWASLSTKTAKTTVSTVDPETALEKVDSLDVTRWEYDSQPDVEHLGPMAEQFYDAFGLGSDERRIANVDADGVALAAIQGLSAKLDEKADRIEQLEAENERKDDRIAELEERLAAVESQVGTTAQPADD